MSARAQRVAELVTDINATAMDIFADAINSDDPNLCQRIALNGMSNEDAQHLELVAKDCWQAALNKYREEA